PGISFDGIKPGTTFTYTFPAQQSGTYWYHSHSGLQEQAGIYGAIVIEPKGREPFRYDREYVIVLSDFHPTQSPETILAKLKKMPDYYNYQQRTAGAFFKDVSEKGFAATVSDRLDWGDMRMTPTDITDVSGYTFLMNGKSAAQNWTAAFKKGERVRLRFINAAAMTFFDVRIPGLKMTVVQADGLNVRPVPVDEFRIAVAETYDVIVLPTEDKAYTVFAESMARTGYVRGTLSPGQDQTAAVPALRKPPLLTMADMSHDAMGGMDHSKMNGMDHGSMGGMDHSKIGAMDHSKMGAMDHSKMSKNKQAPKPDPFYTPGSGLAPRAADGGKVLSYADLKAFRPLYKHRKADREIVIRLTGNMERYIWSINGKKYSDAEPIKLKF
ncbi:MAG: copper resistance system multicopper oxidase, partial [Rhodospirillales bacterium]